MTYNYKDGSKTVTLAEVGGSDLSCFGALDFAVCEILKVMFYVAFETFLLHKWCSLL